jgi:IS605 OrfB family transposase
LKTLKFKIRKLNKQQFNILKDFSHYSNNLYNYSLYICKKYFEETNKYIGYVNLEKEVKNNENYKLLPVQSAQQIVKLIDKNFRSFFVLLNKKRNGKYHDNIKLPQFKKKGNMFNIIFTSQNSFIKNNELMLCSSREYNKKLNVKQGLGNIRLPFTFKFNGIYKQLIIKPINNGQYFYCYIQYEENKKEQGEKKYNENYLSIDLGINNLCSCFNSLTGQSFILNGKILKSYNAYFNKQQSKIRSELKLKNNKYWSKKLERLNQKRYWYIDNYFNQIVSYLIKYCKNNNIDNLIIGYNELWKYEINLGKQVNQKFMMIPFYLLKRKIEDKCLDNIINFIFINESYTSKCSSLDLESVEKHDIYLGKRVKRGLFKTSKGVSINSDINGSINILRKVIGDEFIKKFQPVMDLMLNPVRINILTN